MLRITKDTHGVNVIKLTSGQDDELEIDSFVIIPGVTNYNHIYSFKNYLCFVSDASNISVSFRTEQDLEKYFTQLIREIKLNQITNVNIDTKK